MTTKFSPLERIGVPVCVVNQQGRLVAWNQSATAFFRRPPESVIGSDWHSVIHSARTPAGCALCRTYRSVQRGGDLVPIEASISVDNVDQRVTIMPLPMGDTSETMGFLIFAAHKTNRSGVQPVAPIAMKVPLQHLSHKRALVALTPRERQILACVVEGFDARGIGIQLGITHATARNYVQRILNKLGVRNKAEAVNVALTHNLLAS